MKDNNKISIKFDLNTLDMFIMYSMLENNINVTKADLIDLQALMNNIKIDIYKNDVNLYARMIFIISILKAKIDERISKKFLLLDYCKNNMNELSLEVLEEQIIPMIEDEDSQLDESEIIYIKKLIIKNLKYSYVYKYKDSVLELNTLLSDDSYNNIDDINDKFETLLVIDSTTGQNGLEQAKIFNEIVDLTGIILTKFDGTAKGGIIFPITNELKKPIKFIGVGEGIEDLRKFDSKEFVEAIFSD